MKKYIGIEKLRIEGHTDSQGSEKYNVDLSKRRAFSVKKYLVSKGVDISRLSSIGMGPYKPIATNSTNEGRYANRRVEFKVLKFVGNREIIIKIK